MRARWAVREPPLHSCFHIHNYLSHKELTFHIRLNEGLTIGAGHKIATAIEKAINDKFDMTATIHVEPL